LLLGCWRASASIFPREAPLLLADGELTNLWAFDSRGRVTLNVIPVGTLNYTYDGNGNQIRVSPWPGRPDGE
jgi:hypothetical protein